jgi:hypothetical protein
MDPKPMALVAILPKYESGMFADVWSALMVGVAKGVYRAMPKSIKLMVAPPGTLSVLTVKFIKEVPDDAE